MLEIKKLHKSYPIGDTRLHVLKGIDLSVKQGELVSIMGSSGSGKSTLLSLLAGLDTASGGEIFLDGEPLHNLDEEARAGLRAAKVGFVFQSFMLVQSLTALENVMLPAELAGERDAKQQALILLEKVGLGHRIDHYPSQLSGGEQQRVAIARAFIGTPKILFADEPSANLDSKNGKMIESLLFDLNSQHGTTLILVTHDEALAQKCQHIIQIEGGRLVENSAEEIANVG